MKRRLIILTLVLLAGCGGDDEPVAPEPPQTHYESLTTREGVLNNIQESYNNRSVENYEALLDVAFTFLLSDGDVNNGLPTRWYRDTELALTQHLFSRTQAGALPVVKNIEMDIAFEDGVTWTDVTPAPEPPGTWFSTTTYYFFQITVDQAGTDEDLTYYPDSNSRAQFTVCNVGTNQAPNWRLVEMHDLGAGTLLRSALASTQQTTWGNVKSRYR